MLSICIENFELKILSEFKIKYTGNCQSLLFRAKKYGTGWMDVWMDGWMDGWMGGWMVEQG